MRISFLGLKYRKSERLNRARAGAQLWDHCASGKLRTSIVMVIKSDKEEKSHYAAVKEAGH